jgi:hypothetical protein
VGEAVHADSINEKGVGGEALACARGIDLILRLEDAGVGLSGALCIGQEDTCTRTATCRVGDDAWGEAKQLVGIASEGGETGDVFRREAVSCAGVRGVEDGDFVRGDGDSLIGGSDLELQINVAGALCDERDVIQGGCLKTAGGTVQGVVAGWKLAELIGSGTAAGGCTERLSRRISESYSGAGNDRTSRVGNCS